MTTSLLAATSPRRRGVTLTEVLMSLMIMSIGVVSLATLFPIASLRVLEATNLTNSTIVNFNAEGIVDAFPSMVNDADGSGSTQEELGRNFIVDPLGWHEHVDQFGITSVTDPRLIYFEYNRPAGINLPALTIPNGTPTPTLRPTRFFGENPAVGSRQIFTTLDVTRQIVSLPDTTTDIVDTFPDPDGTVTTAYVTNASSRITGLVLPADVDLSVVTLEPSLYQVLIFDKTGKYSETRRLSTVTGQQIEWAEDLNRDGSIGVGEDRALPLRFTADASGTPNVGLVRIEQPIPYYSWLLTVHKDFNGPVNVDVVVFNKRDFSQLSEQIYFGDLVRHTVGPDGVPGTANGGPNSDGDDNGNGIINDASEFGYPGSDDVVNDLVTVNWDPTLYPGGTANPVEKPPIRRGAYIYDALNCYWYRIREIASSTSSTSSTLGLESAVLRNNTEDLSLDGTLGDIPGEDLNNDGNLDRSGVIIPRGVIAVFPLKTR
ncbi:MAG: prepilin-type N-terminal cleavage/methylation domain-containing protein [Rhodopirellula sp.]|nr:prepilin-type N-terminal cleavage/methylation domain-containing protein [Rhodopirellula sp.]